MNKTEFDEGLEFVRAALRSIHEEAGGDELTDDQQSRFDEGLAYIAKAEKLAERTQKLAAVQSAPITYVENGDGAKAGEIAKDFQVSASTRTADDPFDLADRAAFWGMSGDQIDTDLRGRALKALETMRGADEDARERVTKRIERAEFSAPDADTNFRGISEHVLRTGSPTYRSAYSKYLKTPSGLTLNEAERTAMSLTSANGGYLLPFLLDPTIILTNAGSENPFRQISRVISVNQNVWHGVASAGITAEWLGEASEVGDDTPTFSQPTITAYKAAIWAQASFEFVEDGNIEAEIGPLAQDAKNNLEATAFATGNGTTQPKGIVTVLQAVTASRVAGSSGAAGAADLAPADIFALDNALPPRHRDANPVWVADRSLYNKARQFSVNSQQAGSFWVDLGGGRPAEMIGYPVYQSSAMDSTIVSGSNDDVLILGNFSQYVIVDRIGMSMAYEPLVKGASFRPTGSVGWFFHWRVGGDTTNADAFRMLRL